MKDWLIRSLKTFVQAFFGVFIPELILILNGAVPLSWTEWKTWLIPVVTSAIAAGISAAWNAWLEHKKGGANVKDKI